MICGPWQRWFAWHPVEIDGLGAWLCIVERRRVTEAETLSAFAAPEVTSFWQYRHYWPVDHQEGIDNGNS